MIRITQIGFTVWVACAVTTWNAAPVWGQEAQPRDPVVSARSGLAINAVESDQPIVGDPVFKPRMDGQATIVDASPRLLETTPAMIETTIDPIPSGVPNSET